MARHLTRAALLTFGSMVVTAAIIAPLLSFPTAAYGAANESVLRTNEQLNPGEALVSPDGRFRLVNQLDGNTVEYDSAGYAIWASRTFIVGSVLRMQDDGNVVIIAPGNNPVWSTGTSGQPGADLELQSDANTVVYAPGHVATWASQGVSGSVPGNFSPALAAAWASSAANAYDISPYVAGDPCTDFVSRALRAGGLPLDAAHGWIPPGATQDARAVAISRYMGVGSQSPWVTVQALRSYLLAEGWVSERLIYPENPGVYAVSPGDIIYYEWNGVASLSHVHVALVTSVSDGQILVTDQNGGSSASLMRPWNYSALANMPLPAKYRGERAYVWHWAR